MIDIVKNIFYNSHAGGFGVQHDTLEQCVKVSIANRTTFDHIVSHDAIGCPTKFASSDVDLCARQDSGTSKIYTRQVVY